MLEIQYEKFGAPSVVAKCVNAADPGEPSAWDAIVEVEACAINPSDLAIIKGQYGKQNKLPAKIGMEAAGTVVAVGSSVANLATGDRVMVLANDNWAQKRKVAETLLVKVPKTFDPLQVALMKVNPATALMMLRLRRMSKNDWVIQNAPLSSVGRTIIQLAKSLNLRTINIVRRPDAVQEVMELGGDIALEDGEALPSRVQKAIGKGKIKLALDAVGGLSTWSLASCLDRDGMLVNYGMLSGELCQIGPDQLIFNGINLQGFWLSRILNRLTEQERNDLFDEIIELMSSGTIHGIVDSCFSLNQIADALKRAETPGRAGKVMLLPNGEL